MHEREGLQLGFTTDPKNFRNIVDSSLQHFGSFVVRPIGLEPTRRKTLDPKSSASTNFATGAKNIAVAKLINNFIK